MGDRLELSPKTVKVLILLVLGVFSLLLAIGLGVTIRLFVIFISSLILVAALLVGLFYGKKVLLEVIDTTGAEELKENPLYLLWQFILHFGSTFILGVLISTFTQREPAQALALGAALHFGILVARIFYPTMANTMYDIIIGGSLIAFLSTISPHSQAVDFLTFPVIAFLTFISLVVTFLWIVVQPLIWKRNSVAVKQHRIQKQSSKKAQTSLKPRFPKDAKALWLSIIAGLAVSIVVITTELLAYYFDKGIVFRVGWAVLFVLFFGALCKYSQMKRE